MFPHNNEGRNAIHDIYDLETITEIANHGCESGVCSEHIYYADTIKFFETYEGEILDLIHTRYGTDELVEIFKRSEADYDMYRNECTWLFIENVAQDQVMELERMQEDEDAIIGEYLNSQCEEELHGDKKDFKPDYTLSDSLTDAATDLMNLSVYNRPGSMNEARYSQSWPLSSFGYASSYSSTSSSKPSTLGKRLNLSLNPA